MWVDRRSSCWSRHAHRRPDVSPSLGSANQLELPRNGSAASTAHSMLHTSRLHIRAAKNCLLLSSELCLLYFRVMEAPMARSRVLLLAYVLFGGNISSAFLQNALVVSSAGEGTAFCSRGVGRAQQVRAGVGYHSTYDM